MAFLSWWFGTILADMYTGRVKIKFVYIAVFTPLAFLIPLNVFGYIHPVISFNLNGLGFAGLIALCFVIQEQGYELKLLNKLKWLGDISYSLYVGHCSILVLMSGWLMSQGANGTLPKSQHWIFVGAAITFVYAYFSYFIAEKPFLGKRKH
jgi:peptidoglycan/LPS O-acetylase OafA/YrhL